MFLIPPVELSLLHERAGGTLRRAAAAPLGGLRLVTGPVFRVGSRAVPPNELCSIMVALSLFSSDSPSEDVDETTQDTVSSSIISEGASIEGTLDLTSVNLSIEGTVHGDISTDGRVVVAEGAEVEGTIRAQTIRVAGYVEGHLLATEHLVLCPSAKVHATLEADILEIQPGADFAGEVPDTEAFVPEEERSASALDSDEMISESDLSQSESGHNGNEHVEAQ